MAASAASHVRRSTFSTRSFKRMSASLGVSRSSLPQGHVCVHGHQQRLLQLGKVNLKSVFECEDPPVDCLLHPPRVSFGAQCRIEQLGGEGLALDCVAAHFHTIRKVLYRPHKSRVAHPFGRLRQRGR